MGTNRFPYEDSAIRQAMINHPKSVLNYRLIIIKCIYPRIILKKTG